MNWLTIIGAGINVFTKNIVVDLLTIDQFKTIEIILNKESLYFFDQNSGLRIK